MNLVVRWHGACGGRVVDVADVEGDRGAGRGAGVVARLDHDVEAVDVGVARCAREGLGRLIEREPGRKLRRIDGDGQRVVGVRVGKKPLRQLPREGRVLGCRPLHPGKLRLGRVVDVGDLDRERRRRARAKTVGGDHAHIDRADIVVFRRRREATGRLVEGQPARQRLAGGELRRKHERFAWVDVGKQVRRQRKALDGVFGKRSIGERARRGRGMVAPGEPIDAVVGLDPKQRPIGGVAVDACPNDTIQREGDDVARGFDTEIDEIDPGEAERAHALRIDDRVDRRVARVDQVGVAATAALEAIRPATAVEDVGAGEPLDRVVAGIADEHVPAPTTVEVGIPVAGDEHVLNAERDVDMITGRQILRQRVEAVGRSEVRLAPREVVDEPRRHLETIDAVVGDPALVGDVGQVLDDVGVVAEAAV